jgi:hypothetical protein
MIGLHPDYGLTDELRLAAVQDAEIISVKQSAALHRVGVSSVYKWRKVPALMKQMMEGDDE